MEYVIEKTKNWKKNDKILLSNPYDTKLHKHGNYSFTKRPNDNVYGVGKWRHKHEIRIYTNYWNSTEREWDLIKFYAQNTAMKQTNKQLQWKIGDPEIEVNNHEWCIIQMMNIATDE